MRKKLRICCIPIIFYLSTQIPSYLNSSNDFGDLSISNSIQQISRNNLNEKRASPAYDTIMKEDGMLHYRVLFWVPKDATKFVPYAVSGVNTDVSSHGPVEKWSVEETKITNEREKLVFIFVPKTFVYLYGDGFEKVIHVKYS